MGDKTKNQRTMWNPVQEKSCRKCVLYYWWYGYLFLHACGLNCPCENWWCCLRYKSWWERVHFKILLTDVPSYWMLLGALLERFMIISIHHKAHHSEEQKVMPHSFCVINDSHVMKKKHLGLIYNCKWKWTL